MPPKFASNLGDESDGDSPASTSSPSSDEEEEGDAKNTGGKKTAHALADPPPDALVSNLPLAGAVPEPEPGTAWDWGTARDAAPPPDDADRAATVAAAAAVSDVALAAAAEAARRRAEALGGDRGDGKPLTHKQREKRKRDAGMQGGGHKNYVEEEKRVAREMGADGG